MKRKGISKKIIAYVCAAAMVITALTGISMTTAKAADDAGIALQLAQEGTDKTGPQSVSGDYSYQGGFSIPDGVTSDYTLLEITYSGDLSSLRLEGGGNLIWFDPAQANHFVTEDGSDIVLNTDTETTVVIDLAQTGVSYVAGDFVHLHAGNGTDFTYEFKSVTLKKVPTVDDIILNGDENGESSMLKGVTFQKNKLGAINPYKYMGFATLKEATSDYKYLVLTYSGDIGSIRFEFAYVYVDDAGNTVDKQEDRSPVTWFNKEGQEYYFVTADGSDIPLDGGKGTTIVIDLEKSGIDIGKYNSVHMHSGYGEEPQEFTFQIGMARLSASADIIAADVMPKEEGTTTTKAPETTTPAKVTKPGKPTVKTATKKKSAKKVKVSLKKKVANAAGYQIAVYATKKNAKKDKKALVKKFSKKTTKTIKSKKLKNKKKLFVVARAYVLDSKGAKVYGSWSKPKKVSIKK